MQSSNLDSQLSPKQREVLLALVQGSTISAAASAAGLHRSTIHNWCRENTVFRAALRDAESQHATAVMDGYRELTANALERLSILINDEATPASVRLRAITLVLDRVANADPYTKPAAPQLTVADVDRIIGAGAQVGAEERTLRETMAAQPAAQPAPAPQAVPRPDPQVARSAPCPCGSGEKFKRCCGRGAPGVINRARAA